MIQSILQKKSIIVICLLALLLRLPLLSGSFWLDEAAQALESVRPLAAQLQIAEDYQPPLFHLVVHGFSRISHQEWWLRVPSLVSGVGTVGFLYLLLAEKFGKRQAMVGSILFALSPFHIFYSQELRPYALAAFFATVSWYLLVSNRWRAHRFILYSTVVTLGMYTMYLFPFILLSQLLYILVEDRAKLRQLLMSFCVVAILCLPWVPSFLTQLRIGQALTSQLPGWAQAVATPQIKALPLTLGKFFVGQVRFSGNYVLMGTVALLLLSLGVTAFAHRRSAKSRFLLYWLITPIVGSWLLSFFIPVIQPKRLLICLPALFGLFILNRSRFSTAIVWLALVIEIISLGMYWRTPTLQRENWRHIIATIESNAPQRSIALFAFPTRLAPWEWYSQKTVGYQATGTLLVRNLSETTLIRSQLTTVSTVYLFDYLRDLTDPNHVLESMLIDSGFIETGKIDGQTIGFVRIFARMEKN